MQYNLNPQVQSGCTALDIVLAYVKQDRDRKVPELSARNGDVSAAKAGGDK